MKIAFLINERALRDKLARTFEGGEAVIEEYSTAAKALAKLATNPYDLVVLHWKVHPGLGSGDSRIDELADLIPLAKLNRNVLYWEVGLRVIDAMREKDSPNRATPVIVIFPDLGPAAFDTGDDLTRESVEADLAGRQPAEAVYWSSAAEFVKAVGRHLSFPGA